MKDFSEDTVQRKTYREDLELVQTILIMAVMVIIVLLAASWVGSPIGFKADEVAGQAGEGATSSAAPSEVAEALPSTAPVPPPADLTGLWIGAGIAGAVLVLLILTVGLVTLVKRSRHGALKLRQEQAAQAEDRRQALVAWTAVTQTHQRLKDKAFEVETDWDMVFSYPVLVDPTVATTAAFHRALRAVDSISPEAPATLHLGMDITSLPYPQRVEAAEEAWLAAWDFAKRTGTKLIPAGERKKINQIVKLLKLARDGGGSEHERAVAYERAEKLVSELQWVKVPERALQAIGAESRLMLEATPV
jgi:hypothetical protein